MVALMNYGTALVHSVSAEQQYEVALGYSVTALTNSDSALAISELNIYFYLPASPKKGPES